MLRTVVYLRNKRQLIVSPEGHWCGPAGVESDLRYLVLTDSGQEMFTPQEFAKKYGWKNDPIKARSASEEDAHECATNREFTKAAGNNNLIFFREATHLPRLRVGLQCPAAEGDAIEARRASKEYGRKARGQP